MLSIKKGLHNYFNLSKKCKFLILHFLKLFQNLYTLLLYYFGGLILASNQMYFKDNDHPSFGILNVNITHIHPRFK